MSSSLPQLSSSSGRTSSPETFKAHYAFLIHSQDTLRHTLPPNVDNESIARQKRRRTSPEDQAILEAEFEQESRPDKAARKTIAGRVRGMGEREVQIWFQNRRQNIRRRSRPLLPHEMPMPASANADDANYRAEDLPQLQSSSSGSGSSDKLAANVSSSPEDKNLRQTSATQSSDPPTQPSTRSLRRSLSGKRLAMTSGGAAKLLADDESSPSPPRPQQSLAESDLFDLTHPLSAASPKPISNPFSLLRKSSSGRSRDSRAWEFWCDGDVKNDLAKKAEQEQSGSAAAAIGLIRSNSRKTLAPNTQKPNLPLSQSHTADSYGKPSLRRSRTSTARLETNDSHNFHLHEDKTEKVKTSLLSSRFAKSPTGDSDKENNGPDQQQPSHPRRKGLTDKSQPTLPAKRAALKPSQSVPGSMPEASSSKRRRNRSRTRLPPLDSRPGQFDPDEDEEIARFMGSRPDEPTVALDDEQTMDVIQGLLSLRKG